MNSILDKLDNFIKTVLYKDIKKNMSFKLIIDNDVVFVNNSGKNYRLYVDVRKGKDSDKSYGIGYYVRDTSSISKASANEMGFDSKKSKKETKFVKYESYGDKITSILTETNKYGVDLVDVIDVNDFTILYNIKARLLILRSSSYNFVMDNIYSMDEEEQNKLYENTKNIGLDFAEEYINKLYEERDINGRYFSYYDIKTIRRVFTSNIVSGTKNINIVLNGRDSSKTNKIVRSPGSRNYSDFNLCTKQYRNLKDLKIPVAICVYNDIDGIYNIFNRPDIAYRFNRDLNRIVPDELGFNLDSVKLAFEFQNYSSVYLFQSTINKLLNRRNFVLYTKDMATDLLLNKYTDELFGVSDIASLSEYVYTYTDLTKKSKNPIVEIYSKESAASSSRTETTLSTSILEVALGDKYGTSVGFIKEDGVLVYNKNLLGPKSKDLNLTFRDMYIL